MTTHHLLTAMRLCRLLVKACRARDRHPTCCATPASGTLKIAFSERSRCCHWTWWINQSPPANPFQAGFFISGQSGQAISPRNEAPSDFCCLHFHPLPRDMTLLPYQACVALKRKRAAMGKRAARMPSIVDGFYRLPSPVFAADSVGPAACTLARAAARALLAVIGADAQNDSRRTTIPGGRADVG